MAGPKLISAAVAEHYNWGDAAGPSDAWHLVKRPELSVILECMLPGARETRHYHTRARQFFWVLEGTLTIEVEGQESAVGAGAGMEVAPGQPHQVFNRSQHDARFLVVSQPPSHGDRVNS